MLNEKTEISFHFQNTTISEIALFGEELELGQQLLFTAQNPDYLHRYGLIMSEIHIIQKMKIFDENDYVIAVGHWNGSTTIAKSISILINDGIPLIKNGELYDGDVYDIDDEDDRISVIENFLEEYYEKYMDKEETNNDYIEIKPAYIITWEKK